MTPRAPQRGGTDSDRGLRNEQVPVWGGLLPPRPTEVDPDLAGLVNDLNDEQYAAVTHGVGPLLVVAGAGTGKTHVITRRIAWLKIGRAHV